MIVSTLNFDASVRKIDAKVELNNGSTLAFTNKDYLKSFKIERLGTEGKFFGFGVAHKANIKLVDVARALDPKANDSVKISLGINNTFVAPVPSMYITEARRDENTNELSITVYDNLNLATGFTIDDLELTAPYTLGDLIGFIATYIGLQEVNFINISDNELLLNYENGANFDGTETLRSVLDNIAEVTQSIYYINNYNHLIFKRLNKDDDAVFNIDREKYITLNSKTNRRLAAITHATELGDNLTVNIEQSGSTQIVRNNPLWELREDLPALLENAKTKICGLTLNQFECNWRGNPLVEIGDKIGLTTKDGELVNSFLLNDSFEYNGSLNQQTSWSYTDNNEDPAANPTNLGEVLKKTFARVDKANERIDIVAGESSNIMLEQEKIIQSVKATNDELADYKAQTEQEIADIYSAIEQTKSDLTISFNESIGNVDSVTTTTGFKFNKDGLEISKTDAPTATRINEDGMTVSRNGAEVLTANNTGVNAENLHATTYLIIGTNSRFEDYGTDRTGCFWIG